MTLLGPWETKGGAGKTMKILRAKYFVRKYSEGQYNDYNLDILFSNINKENYKLIIKKIEEILNEEKRKPSNKETELKITRIMNLIEIAKSLAKENSY